MYHDTNQCIILAKLCNPNPLLYQSRNNTSHKTEKSESVPCTYKAHRAVVAQFSSVHLSTGINSYLGKIAYNRGGNQVHFYLKWVYNSCA